MRKNEPEKTREMSGGAPDTDEHPPGVDGEDIRPGKGDRGTPDGAAH